MSADRFLAFDLGAESGRAVVGTLGDGTLSLEEIHRFPNRPVLLRDTLHWDALELYANLLEGMRRCARQHGSRLRSVGIDTWGVDFGLLARDGSLLQNPVHYRDRRTEGVLAEIEQRIPAFELFRRTGMCPAPLQSLCQLVAMRRAGSPLLEAAATFLMMPGLLAYFLTGVKACERTNAVNTQFYNQAAGSWDGHILGAFDLPAALLPPLIHAGTVLGPLDPLVAGQCGLEPCPVVAPCTHDTGSAVAAAPGKGEGWAFLSSGTWSVVGALTPQPVVSREAFSAGFCNELTLDGWFLCRNLAGLWLLQRSRQAWADAGQSLSYEDLTALARLSPSGPIVDPSAGEFAAPTDMNAAIRQYCERTSQPAPDAPGAFARVVLESLALSYREALDKLSLMLGRRFEVLHLIGGGARNTLLCQLTADATGVPVLAGPIEATALGNVLVQALGVGALASSNEVRELVRRSVRLAAYEPADTARLEDLYLVFRRLRESRGSGQAS